MPATEASRDNAQERPLRGGALEAANAFLPAFLADLTPRFARAPVDATAAWRPAPRRSRRPLLHLAPGDDTFTKHPLRVRVLLLIRSITWGHEAWPEVKPLLPRALKMRRQIAREGWWN